MARVPSVETARSCALRSGSAGSARSRPAGSGRLSARRCRCWCRCRRAPAAGQSRRRRGCRPRMFPRSWRGPGRRRVTRTGGYERGHADGAFVDVLLGVGVRRHHRLVGLEEHPRPVVRRAHRVRVERPVACRGAGRDQLDHAVVGVRRTHRHRQPAADHQGGHGSERRAPPDHSPRTHRAALPTLPRSSRRSWHRCCHRRHTVPSAPRPSQGPSTRRTPPVSHVHLPPLRHTGAAIPCPRSSAGQSSGLLIRRSQVRILSGAPHVFAGQRWFECPSTGFTYRRYRRMWHKCGTQR